MSAGEIEEKLEQFIDRSYVTMGLEKDAEINKESAKKLF